MNDLIKQRKKIDRIDKKILQLIEERVVIMKEIGKIKKKHALAITDLEREKDKLYELLKLAKEKEIPGELIEEVWNTFFKYANEIQK